MASIVQTTTGNVRGLSDPATGACRFLGIPYARPPVGELRFRPPVAIAPWSGTLDATAFGAASVQYFDTHEAELDEISDSASGQGESPAFVGSEDCLTLNVWTSALGKGGAPVIIWIHGGANWLESSRLRVYHGDTFAAHGVVFVSINYRLGLFGFLDVSVVGGREFRGAHSNGLRDQLLALSWIHDNIESFGGDRNNVTLMGESAGSMDISWLLATGKLGPWVRRVVLMSGVAGVSGFASSGGRSNYDEAAGQEQAREVLDILQIRSREDLLSLPTSAIMNRLVRAVPERDMLFFWDSIFYPRVDGELLNSTPFNAVREGSMQGRDVMIGTTAYEMGLWTLWDATLDQCEASRTVTRLPMFPAEKLQTTAQLYDREFGHEPAGVRSMHLLGDAMFVMPSVLLAERLSLTSTQVWMYQFAWEVPHSPLRATHAADLFFFFDKLHIPAAHSLIGSPSSDHAAQERARLAEAMHGAILSFARHGDPSAHRIGGLPEWPRYSTVTRDVMMFDARSHIARDPFDRRRRWWLEQIYGETQQY